MKKRILFLFVLALFIGACGAKNNGNDDNNNTEVVDLDFWTFWGSELRRPIIDRIIDDFNKDSENIKVTHTYNPYGDIWTKELAAISSGNPPDVVINEINDTAIRGMKQRAEDLSGYIEAGFSDKFFDHLWDAMKYEDGIYGIPFTTDTRVLFYNKDHFREVGLDPDTPPQTWAQLDEYADMLDIKDGDNFDRIGFYPLYNVGSDVWILNAQGGNYLDEDGVPDIDNDVNVDVLEWLLARRDHYGKSTIDAYQAQVDGDQSHPFLTGQLSMVVATGTFYNQIKNYAQDFELGVAFIPEYKEGTGHTSWGGGFIVEIPYGAKNKDASWEFIKYLTDNHAQVLWGALNFDNVANIEASNDVASSSELDELDQYVYGVLDENMQHTILTPMPVKMPNYYELVNPVLEDIILGRITPADGLSKIQADLEALYEEN